jgi:hypothetical protein
MYDELAIEMVKYLPGTTILWVQDEERRVREVEGSGCWHMCAVGSDRILRTRYMKVKLKDKYGEPTGRSQRLTRFLVGLHIDDPRMAILTCEDSRCCRRDHIMVGTACDVPRSRKVLRDGTVTIREKYAGHLGGGVKLV